MRPSLLVISALTFSVGLAIPALAQDAGTPSSNSSPQNAPIPQKLVVVSPKDTGGGSLAANRSRYRLGQQVKFKFTITNATNKTIHYDFLSSQQFDITLSDANGRPVWDWAQGKTFAPTITRISLKPNQKRTFEAAWYGRDAQGHPVAAGVYTATARMTSDDHPAITGGVVVDTDTDPNNLGVPTRSPAENGAVRAVHLNPPMVASTTVAIGVPAPKR